MTAAVTERQLPLDLQYRPALDREVFLVAPGNAAAVGWIDRWPDWPSSALVLEGPKGSGKTHLASVWRARAKAWAVDGRDITAARVPELLANGRFGVIEAADEAQEEPLLHLYNSVAEHDGNLVLTATRAPAQWGIALPDLASRLRSLPVARLAMPDDALFKAVLAKLFGDRRLRIGDDVIAFLASRLERSYEAAAEAVEALDRAGLAQRRRVTVPFARAVLGIGETR